MQRMLVGLVLFLTVVVGILGVVVLDLAGEVDDRRVTRPSVAVRPSEPGSTVHASRVQTLEDRMAGLLRAIDKLKVRTERAENEARAARTEARRARKALAAAGVEGPLDPDPSATGTGTGLDGDRGLNEDGTFQVTEQDMDYFLAVQRRVERKRRIAGMTRNVMRRIDRMADKGEISALSDDLRGKVEETIHSFVAEGDDLVTRYIRQPDAEVEAMSADERRERMTEVRDRIVAEAQRALEPLIGNQDAGIVAENSLQNPWGVRLRGSKRRRDR